MEDTPQPPQEDNTPLMKPKRTRKLTEEQSKAQGEDESTLDSIVAQQKTDYEAKLKEMKLTSNDIIIKDDRNKTDKQ